MDALVKVWGGGYGRDVAQFVVIHTEQVLAACPSLVDTPMIDGATEGTPELRQSIDKVVSLGRVATIEEVSDVIVFLPSPMASPMTGVECINDGGATLYVYT